MIKKEYDNIDELVQDDYCEKNDYETAKEANDLLMDALQLTEVQKTMLKGSYAFLEELHRKQILSQFMADPETVRVGKNTFLMRSMTDSDVVGIELIGRKTEITILRPILLYEAPSLQDSSPVLMYTSTALRMENRYK